MQGTVSGIEMAKEYKDGDWMNYVLVKVNPDELGYVVMPFPVEMASLFPLGKRVEITVSEVR